MNRQQAEREFAALLPTLNRVLGPRHPTTTTTTAAAAAKRKYDRLIGAAGINGE